MPGREAACEAHAKEDRNICERMALRDETFRERKRLRPALRKKHGIARFEQRRPIELFE